MEMEQLEITEKVSWIREGLEPPTPRLPVVCSYHGAIGWRFCVFLCFAIYHTQHKWLTVPQVTDNTPSDWQYPKWLTVPQVTDSTPNDWHYPKWLTLPQMTDSTPNCWRWKSPLEWKWYGNGTTVNNRKSQLDPKGTRTPDPTITGRVLMLSMVNSEQRNTQKRHPIAQW